MWINTLFYCAQCFIIYSMEEVYKINPNMSSVPPPSPQSSEEKHTTIYVAVVLIVAFLIGIVFYMVYNNAPEDIKVEEERIIYTHGEKLEILKGLAGSPEDISNIPPIEERRAILSEIAENKPADTKEYSQEEKLNILYSLQ